MASLNIATGHLVIGGLTSEDSRMLEELDVIRNHLLPRIINLMEMTRDEIIRLKKNVKIDTFNTPQITLPVCAQSARSPPLNATPHYITVPPSATRMLGRFP